MVLLLHPLTAYVCEIFGNRWRVLDRIERLPEQLPMLYLSLTR